MELNLDEGSNPLQNVIQQIIFEPNIQKKLEAIDVVINALDDDTVRRTDAKRFQRFLHSLFDDEEFMRKLSYISQMKDVPELGIEYTGADYLSTPDYHYDIEFERKIVDIKKRLQKFLGKVIREFSKGVEIEL